VDVPIGAVRVYRGTGMVPRLFGAPMGRSFNLNHALTISGTYLVSVRLLVIRPSGPRHQPSCNISQTTTCFRLRRTRSKEASDALGRIDNWKILTPGSDRHGVLLRHRFDNLADVIQIVDHPCGE
jgi:hypothetical protein